MRYLTHHILNFNVTNIPQSGMAVHGPRGEGFAHKEYRPYDIQDLQLWQDRANEAVMVLEANTDVLKSILKFYTGLIARKDFPNALRIACEDDILTFSSQLEEIISDFNMQTARAKLLVNIISDRKELVLQHLQGQAAERTEQLNRNLEREAVVMRIVTIVTLIYLPATFTSVSWLFRYAIRVLISSPDVLQHRCCQIPRSERQQ